MSADLRLWLTIVLAGAGTFATRLSFLAVAHRMADPPPGVRRVLRMIPPAALSALILPAFVRPEGHVDLTQPRFAVGILCTVLAFWTRNVLLVLGVGLALLTILEL